MPSSYKRARGWLLRWRHEIYRWAHLIVPMVILSIAVRLRATSHGFVEAVSDQVFDEYQRLRPRAYQPVPVRIVDIDDESLARLGQWPWPRDLLARLTDRMHELGAAAIAFDIVFAEPDRTSPAQVAKSPELKGLREQLMRLPDHDATFARSIARDNVVLGFPLIGRENGKTPAVKARFSYAGDGPLAFVYNFAGAVTNLPVLEKAAAGDGNFGFVREGAIIRKVPLIFATGRMLVPSLSLEALRVAQGASTVAVKSSGAHAVEDWGAVAGIREMKVGSLKFPTDGHGEFWVYFTGPAPDRVVPAWCVFDKACAAGKLDGAIAFVGTSAAGLKDLRATPLNANAAGVEVHANVAEMILAQEFLTRPDWALPTEILYMIIFGLLLLMLLPRLGAALCAAVAALGIAGAFYVSWHQFTQQRHLIDPFFPAITVLLIYMSSSLISYLKSEAERKQVRSAFGQYLHPKLVAELAKHPDKLKLGGETREMTVLFCDIRGFTTISEQYDAAGLTHVINRFLTPMSATIMERSGTIDKYIGDCIMAFWNAPEPDAVHAVNACRSALEMHRRLDELNAQWELEDRGSGQKFIPIHIGVGLNTGPCLVGNMGSDQKFNYSVLGDDVNLASRLEGQSKTYGVPTVIGPVTREKTPQFAAVELDSIRVKGKTRPVNIFGLLGSEGLAGRPDFKELSALHGEMLKAYRSRQWDKAEELIASCRKFPFQLKVLYDLYAKRIAGYREQAPAADWDGTFTATTK